MGLAWNTDGLNCFYSSVLGPFVHWLPLKIKLDNKLEFYVSVSNPPAF